MDSSEGGSVVREKCMIRREEPPDEKRVWRRDMSVERGCTKNGAIADRKNAVDDPIIKMLATGESQSCI
jgi:hypothetical protein